MQSLKMDRTGVLAIDLQLFCLCRASLGRSRILVLDEATASIDNAIDSILQRIIRAELEDSTVITVSHRIPTVVDYTIVLAITAGRFVEFDKLMQRDGSLFQTKCKHGFFNPRSPLKNSAIFFLT